MVYSSSVQFLVLCSDRPIMVYSSSIQFLVICSNRPIMVYSSSVQFQVLCSDRPIMVYSPSIQFLVVCSDRLIMAFLTADRTLNERGIPEIPKELNVLYATVASLFQDKTSLYFQHYLSVSIHPY